MRMKCPQMLLKKRQHQQPDAAAAQRKPFLMPIRKSGHWKRRQYEHLSVWWWHGFNRNYLRLD
jgi:hypothetical protein